MSGHKNNSAPRRGGPGHGPGHGMGSGERAKNLSGTFRRVCGMMAPYKGRIIAVIIMTVISVICSVAAPKVLGRIVNIIYAGIEARIKDTGAVFDYGGMLRIGAVLLGLYLLVFLFNYLQQRIMTTVAQNTVYSLRRRVDEKLKRLPLKYYDDNPRGEILSRVTNDVDNISSTLQETLTQMITTVVTVIAVIVMMFTISLSLTLVSLATVVVCLLITKVVSRHSSKYFKEQWSSTGRLNGHIEEIYTGHNVVRLFNKEQEEQARFENENKVLRRSFFKAQFVSGIIMPLMRFVGNLNYVAVCLFGSLKVIAGTLLLGDVTAFISYTKQLTQPIQQVGFLVNNLQSSMASAERVFELLDAQEQVPDAAEPKKLRYPKGHVCFEDVSFRYREDTPLIEHLNLDVEPGKTVAIVGPTGAGKTTLVNLILRFYELNGGRITIDGVDITELTRENLRTCIGMVLQDTWLFNGTIKENIAYGWPPSRGEVTDELVEAAAKGAYADRFIRTLPEGYDTVLGDDASNISQGQKQLLTIARAFLSDPSILILDEATSSVDTRTEVLIQKAMSELMLGRTSFVIAHRLSTIREADVILVMNNGAIVEQGNHKELLEKGGFYAELYNSQFAGGEEAS